MLREIGWSNICILLQGISHFHYAVMNTIHKENDLNFTMVIVHIHAMLDMYIEMAVKGT